MNQGYYQLAELVKSLQICTHVHSAVAFSASLQTEGTNKIQTDKPQVKTMV